LERSLTDLGIDRDTDSLHAGVAKLTSNRRLRCPSPSQGPGRLAQALSVDDVNQLGRDTGQAIRLRTVTPHRLFLALDSALASARVESLADLLRTFNHQGGSPATCESR
jgi:hypothetical protein